VSAPTYEELAARVVALQARIAKQDARIAQLERRLAAPSRKLVEAAVDRRAGQAGAEVAAQPVRA
jgi:hypothetical protein